MNLNRLRVYSLKDAVSVLASIESRLAFNMVYFPKFSGTSFLREHSFSEHMSSFLKYYVKLLSPLRISSSMPFLSYSEKTTEKREAFSIYP